MKVIIYSRVSTDKQTIEQQERTVNEWLEKNNLKATHEVTDEGVSGGITYAKRNLGKVVLPMLEKGDILIVSEISRIGRSMGDINKFVNDELKPRGIRLVVVQMGIDLDCANLKAVDEMLLFAFGFAGQLEKELIQERTKSSLEVRKKKLKEHGYFITKNGKRCYNLGRPRGTTLEGLAEKSAQKRAELAEMSHENTAIWEMCKQYRIDGKNPTKANYEAVAETLKKMGIKSPSGMELNGKRVCSAYFTILDRKQRLGLIDKDGKEVSL